MVEKRLCVPLRLTAYDPKNVPEWIQSRIQLFQEKVIDPSDCTTVVGKDRRYLEVSETFCKLVGYRAEELIGMPYDHLTVPNTADISRTYNLFTQFGYMHGLWLLNHRSGHRVLIRYEAWLRTDENIQSNIEVVQTFA
jgi:PAS domain S-box-containing protein